MFTRNPNVILKRRNRAPLLQHVRCPECGVPMAERTGKTGAFYGCARFPVCVGTRPAGEGVDSYTMLLRDAYTKAAVFLASPRFFGPGIAADWLLSQCLGRALEPDELEHGNVQRLSNEALERGIDAACAYATAQGALVDFLVAAHESRMERIKAKLSFAVDAQMLRMLPRPEIKRRYDTSQFDHLEAAIAQTWNNAGRNCPRCSAWSEFIGKASLFLDDAEGPWDCPSCGTYTQVTDHRGNQQYVFAQDRQDTLSVPGIAFPAAIKPEKS